MKKKTVTKRRVSSIRRKSPKKLHHRVISFFKGDGGIYVIFVLATVMAGAFALTGGVLPTLDPKPSAANQVTIDPDSAKQSSESALQLVDLKVKPTDTPTPTPLNTPTPSPTKVVTPPPPNACLDKTAINLMIDESTSMYDKVGALNSAFGDFLEELNKTTAKTAIAAQAFHGTSESTSSTTAGVSEILAPTIFSGSGKTTITNALTNITPKGGLQGTYMRNGFNVALTKIDAMKHKYPTYNRFVNILFSDGVPETYSWTDSACEARNGDPNNAEATNFICFAERQDPRASTRYVLSDLTKSMKSAVTKNKVYVVAMYNHDSNSREGVLKTKLQELLGAIASTTDNYKETNITNPTSLNTFFRNIVKDICN